MNKKQQINIKKKSSYRKFENPATRRIRKNLLDWYEISRRNLPWRKNTDPYPVWVSEVMLQQTRVNTVIPYFKKFMDAFPDIKALSCSDSHQVLKLWEGMGYYARARNLHKASKIVILDHNGIIPEDYARFKSLPGVGDYIASAVLSIAFGKVLAAVDANVKRVIARLLQLSVPVNDSSFQKIYQTLATELICPSDPGNFNQAMMELGGVVCTPVNPSCDNCPVRDWCKAFVRNEVKNFPLRIPKKKITTHHIAVGVIEKENLLLITKRNPNGLLGGLWEFPGGKVKEGENASEACIREIFEETGIHAEICSFLTRVRHAYTHFRIEMDVFFCRYLSGKICLDGPVDHQWVSREELPDFPFPGANLKFIPLILDNKSHRHHQTPMP